MTTADDLYRALLTSGRLTELRRLTYRCAARRCLLLDAVETPLGVVLHQTRHKYSEPENLRRSSEAGRNANTYDGANHWRPRTYFLERSALAYPDDRPTPQLEITCDHVLGYLLTAPEYRDDWAERHAEVRVRPDCSRFVP